MTLKMFIRVLIMVTTFSPFATIAQSGPGGVGTTNGTSSLKLWLKADDGPSTTTNGQQVSTWSDRSGASNHVSSSGSSRPTFETNVQNGQPAINFNGSAFLQASANSTFENTTATFFIVQKSVTTGASIAICDKNTGFNNEYLYFNDQAFMHRSSGNFISNKHQCHDSIPNDSCVLATVVFGARGTSIDNYINSAISTNGNSSAGGAFSFLKLDRVVTIGQRKAMTSGEFLNGKLLEVIAYNEALRKAQIDSVETCLKAKYAINYDGCQLKPVSIESPKKASSPETYTLYPNPAEGMVTIKTANWEENISVVLYNNLGQVIKSFSDISESNNKLNVKGVAAGNYVLKITIGNQSAIVKQLQIH